MMFLHFLWGIFIYFCTNYDLTIDWYAGLAFSYSDNNKSLWCFCIHLCGETEVYREKKKGDVNVSRRSVSGA